MSELFVVHDWIFLFFSTWHLAGVIASHGLGLCVNQLLSVGTLVACCCLLFLVLNLPSSLLNLLMCFWVQGGPHVRCPVLGPRTTEWVKFQCSMWGSWRTCYTTPKNFPTTQKLLVLNWTRDRHCRYLPTVSYCSTCLRRGRSFQNQLSYRIWRRVRKALGIVHRICRVCNRSTSATRLTDWMLVLLIICSCWCFIYLPF